MKKRVFLIVLDSFGIGGALDAAAFGDARADTLASLSATGLHIPNMTALGLGNIDGVMAVPASPAPRATCARLREKSRGKDTTTGHWEMMGIVSRQPMPTYPQGFPREVIDAFEAAIGRGTLCNLPYSGTDVIRDYGEEHLRTGKVIVYTSADSVFQIAAHEELVPLNELYRICEIARAQLTGAHGVGRVIARPFIGTPGNFTRTANRRDYSLPPPAETVLDRLKAKGLDVIGVGKIGDIFCGQGLTESHPTHGNAEGMEMADRLAERDFSGLCFINLVDFDMLYGHRQDAVGYTLAMNEFDRWLSNFFPKLRESDSLIITADHGCDPSDQSTDHTRECVPFLLYQKGAPARNLGTVKGFDFIGNTVLSLLE